MSWSPPAELASNFPVTASTKTVSCSAGEGYWEEVDEEDGSDTSGVWPDCGMSLLHSLYERRNFSIQVITAKPSYAYSTTAVFLPYHLCMKAFNFFSLKECSGFRLIGIGFCSQKYPD